VEIALTGRSGRTALPARTATRIPRHLLHHEIEMPTNPHNHTPAKTIGNASVDLDNGPGVDVDDNANGWLTWPIANLKPEGTVCSGARHRICPPSATSTASGTRNLIEATSQTPCRTRAEFFRNISVSNPATTANAVDCHK